ncbi:MAE_28990/MAE_18760 family HEPN-like nuclease [Plebeiibacterium sediminum]|uniref:MAE_28990/MAE_18760 family HEPN-like nuclease n=1 Tax=Plebeiibacterium sediminum TaxID=2992112 RepID=A0AAE3M9M5_9BACT|nr:MAE_28990/MAE_18760 family HEPN-like nuclease [Plebeiobacterium sediminum]MCW3789517.1 MAE_28990/MAE_18760 family HEPN-like nuclease [Plebeiobacterium sediminum]
MSDFEIKLERNINERLTALFEIERVLFTSRYNLSKKHSDIFTVQSISMIYAIWEGFIQTSFNSYIDEINNQNINPLLIKDDLFVYHIEDSFKQFNEYPDRHNKKLSFFNNLREFFKLDKLKLNNGINTQSNVSFEILNAILKSFCIEPFPEHWSDYTYPNPNLKEMMTSFLRYRNSVAHGGDISSEEKVSQAVFNKYRKLVTDLMFEIQIKMSDSVNNQLYTKINSAQHAV